MLDAAELGAEFPPGGDIAIEVTGIAIPCMSEGSDSCEDDEYDRRLICSMASKFGI